MKTVLILGCGWLGLPLGERLVRNGYEVIGSVRRQSQLSLLEDKGIIPLIVEVGASLSESAVRKLKSTNPEVLVIAYPLKSRTMSGTAYEKHIQWISENVNFQSLQQVVLASSTSVYPDGMGMVDETNEYTPEGSGLIQLRYEEGLRRLFGKKLVVLRLAGLIGGDRQPGRFLAGKKELPNALSPVNLVDREDVLTAFQKVIDEELTNEVFNICSSEHPSRKEYYTKQAELLALELPEFSDVQIENPKIIVNRKAKEQLGIDFGILK